MKCQWSSISMFLFIINLIICTLVSTSIVNMEMTVLIPWAFAFFYLDACGVYFILCSFRLYLFRCSWGLLYAVFIAIVTVVMIGLLMALKFFQHSNFLLLFVMMFLYGMSVVGFAFICTAFFSKAQVCLFTNTTRINDSTVIVYSNIHSFHYFQLIASDICHLSSYIDFRLLVYWQVLLFCCSVYCTYLSV